MMKSGSSQYTSRMSWVSALFTIGARQMMACPSFTKLPIEMNFRPVRDSIGKMTPPTTFGLPVARLA